MCGGFLPGTITHLLLLLIAVICIQNDHFSFQFLITEVVPIYKGAIRLFNKGFGGDLVLHFIEVSLRWVIHRQLLSHLQDV